jgi:hypothetical protein
MTYVVYLIPVFSTFSINHLLANPLVAVILFLGSKIIFLFLFQRQVKELVHQSKHVIRLVQQPLPGRGTPHVEVEEAQRSCSLEESSMFILGIGNELAKRNGDEWSSGDVVWKGGKSHSCYCREIEMPQYS